MQHVDFRQLYDSRRFIFLHKLALLQHDIIFNLLPLQLASDDVLQSYCAILKPIIKRCCSIVWGELSLAYQYVYSLSGVFGEPAHWAKPDKCGFKTIHSCSKFLAKSTKQNWLSSTKKGSAPEGLFRGHSPLHLHQRFASGSRWGPPDSRHPRRRANEQPLSGPTSAWRQEPLISYLFPTSGLREFISSGQQRKPTSARRRKPTSVRRHCRRRANEQPLSGPVSAWPQEPLSLPTCCRRRANVVWLTGVFPSFFQSLL